MGLMDIVKRTYEFTNKRREEVRKKAAKMQTYELVRAWRNCGDPIAKGVYYQQMQTREDIGDYL